MSGSQATDPAREEAESARQSLLEVLGGLKRTPHNTPGATAIDLTSGAVSMDNGAVRWEFNLGDLDPETVSGRTWHPLGREQEARTIGADCSGGRACVKHGEADGHGGFRDPPGKSKGVRFEVYQGEGLRFGRDLHAEQVAVEALRTLIRFSRLAAPHRTANAPGALAVR
jgi:hypothetical protein